MKGVYKHGKAYRVRKFGAHLGCYDTIEKAEQVALEAEEYHREQKNVQVTQTHC